MQKIRALRNTSQGKEREPNIDVLVAESRCDLHSFDGFCAGHLVVAQNFGKGRGDSHDSLEPRHIWFRVACLYYGAW